MAELSSEQLYAIMRDVFMLSDFRFTLGMSAKDVPGWDSLHHSILMMEIGIATGSDLSAEETAGCANIGELLAMVNEA